MIEIFFSWQSDIGQEATTAAIRRAIARAVPAIFEKHGLQIRPEEATRDVAGSPYIPGKLAEKIRSGDIFVGDITSIAVSSKEKSIPNPNVTFELGLAAAHLGWDRIVLLFNEELADFKNLPFDFDRHRISTYKMKDDAKFIKEKQGNLNELLVLAISTIIEKTLLDHVI